MLLGMQSANPPSDLLPDSAKGGFLAKCSTRTIGQQLTLDQFNKSRLSKAKGHDLDSPDGGMGKMRMGCDRAILAQKIFIQFKAVSFNHPFEVYVLKYISFSLTLLLAGCASSGVVPLSNDVFMISKNTAKFGGGISASAASDVHGEANDFCTKQGKKVEAVDLQLTPGRAGSMGNVTLQFRCV